METRTVHNWENGTSKTSIIRHLLPFFTIFNVHILHSFTACSNFRPESSITVSLEDKKKTQKIYLKL